MEVLLVFFPGTKAESFHSKRLCHSAKAVRIPQNRSVFQQNADERSGIVSIRRHRAIHRDWHLCWPCLELTRWRWAARHLRLEPCPTTLPLNPTMTTPLIERREFLQVAGAAASGFIAISSVRGEDVPPTKKIKVALIGCGRVSGVYLPSLAKCPFVELVSVCDIIPERAERQASKFNIAKHYPHIDQLLSGEPFDLLVNTTDMQEHERLNRQALLAKRHVWSEKPLANSVAAGKELLELAKKQGVRIWGAPTVVSSPAFAYMAKTLSEGTLGRVAAAHAAGGHTGPNWSSFFYDRGGGSLPDLGVYQLTTLTGLLGPAKAVTAMTRIVPPKRDIVGKGAIDVTAEDNAMVLLDHGNGVLSHLQSGFNYFNPRGDDQRYTLNIVGSQGAMAMVGYDWEPHGVDIATRKQPKFERQAIDQGDYAWGQGAAKVAECLATRREPLFTPEHALHVCEIIIASRESQSTGKHIAIETTFKWPVIA